MTTLKTNVEVLRRRHRFGVPVRRSRRYSILTLKGIAMLHRDLGDLRACLQQETIGDAHSFFWAEALGGNAGAGSVS